MFKLVKFQPRIKDNGTTVTDEPVILTKMLPRLNEMAKSFKRHKLLVIKNSLIDGRVKIVDSEEE